MQVGMNRRNGPSRHKDTSVHDIGSSPPKEKSLFSWGVALTMNDEQSKRQWFMSEHKGMSRCKWACMLIPLHSWRCGGEDRR